MPGIHYEALPEYSWPGGSISGDLVLETEKPERATDLVLLLHGREVAQTTVQVGKSRETLVQTVPVVELAFDLKAGLTFLDAEHLAPGIYRLPFRFDLPASAPPSLQTHDWAGPTGLFSGRPDGMYVEYELEARLNVPWWVDQVTRVLVPVFSARRVLGTLPELVGAPSPAHPSLAVRPATSSPMLPGSPYGASYDIQNPTAKQLRRLTVSLARMTEYAARGVRCKVSGPTCSWEVELGGRAPSYSGQIQLEVPNGADATGPWQGALFRTYWMATAMLDVELGFNVEVQGPMIPA